MPARSSLRSRSTTSPGAILDLGSGGGVPGLVLAHDQPTWHVTLLDRRRTRTDFLARMVRRLGWQDRVDVRTGDAETVDGPPFDAVVARGFGPPVHTLTTALGWVRADGLVVISEPPDRRSVGGPRDCGRDPIAERTPRCRCSDGTLSPPWRLSSRCST